MRDLILNNVSTCVGCNRCIRACPIEGANIAYKEGDQIKVRIDNSRCIACGACITECKHDSRDYVDDTERFFSDLKRGVPISLFAAPADRIIGDDFGRLLTWLRDKGVRQIYDVSLGADICTWANIRYIQKNKPASVITQPCPAIVNYIMKHNHDLLPYLSQAQSPMMCTAIYMKKYEQIDDKLAALSPCIAKANEFESNHLVEYNVTMKKLFDYIERNGVSLPREASGFDHGEASLGRVFSMPGGLKENVELYLGKSMRIDKSEGTETVYEALDMYGKRRGDSLPAIFDVLNCAEGCNRGTGYAHSRDIFEMNAIMDNERKFVLGNNSKEEFDALYKEFDEIFVLGDFIRQYVPINVPPYTASSDAIEKAMIALGKTTETERNFDCMACGSATCNDMAKRVACGLNITDNCLLKERGNINAEHKSVMDLSAANLSNIKEILAYISTIKDLSGDIAEIVSTINNAINKYNKMAKEIDEIAMHINIISLNASVEAARAGQHGKTFAVVAEEIRALAGTSKNTVSETENITKQASGSITQIGGMISQIKTEIDKAFSSITVISKTTQETLEKSGMKLAEAP